MSKRPRRESEQGKEKTGDSEVKGRPQKDGGAARAGSSIRYLFFFLFDNVDPIIPAEPEPLKSSPFPVCGWQNQWRHT